MVFEEVNHLTQAWLFAEIDQVVCQNDSKRLVVNHRAGAQDGVPKAKCLRLTNKDAFDVGWQYAAQHLQHLLLVLGFQLALKLIGGVEVIFNRAFVTPGDENQRIDPGRDSFFCGILDQWLVDNWQHFLRICLGCR